MNRSQVENCRTRPNTYLNGNSSSLGGIVGDGLCDISNCYNYADLDGGDNAGGIIGWGNCSDHENPMQIDRCANFGTLTMDESGSPSMGGIAGRLSQTQVRNCYNVGDILAEENTHVVYSFVGGIVGWGCGAMVSDYMPGDKAPDLGIQNCFNLGKLKENVIPMREVDMHYYWGTICGYWTDDAELNYRKGRIENCTSRIRNSITHKAELYGTVGGNRSKNLLISHCRYNVDEQQQMLPILDYDSYVSTVSDCSFLPENKWMESSTVEELITWVETENAKGNSYEKWSFDEELGCPVFTLGETLPAAEVIYPAPTVTPEPTSITAPTATPEPTALPTPTSTTALTVTSAPMATPEPTSTHELTSPQTPTSAPTSTAPLSPTAPSSPTFTLAPTQTPNQTSIPTATPTIPISTPASRFSTRITPKALQYRYIYSKLTWTTDKQAVSYIIYRRPKKSSTFQTLAKVNFASQTTYLDKSGKRGKTYYYAVQAVYASMLRGQMYKTKPVRLANLRQPTVQLRLKKKKGKKFFRLLLKKYEGSNVQIELKRTSKGKSQKGKSDYNIKRYKAAFQWSYSSKNETLECKVRTFSIRKGKKTYSPFTKTKKIILK